MQSITTDFNINVDTVDDHLRISFPYSIPWLDLNGKDADSLCAAIAKHRASISLPAPAAAVSLPAGQPLSPEAIELLNKIGQTMKRSVAAKPAAPE